MRISLALATTLLLTGKVVAGDVEAVRAFLSERLAEVNKFPETVSVRYRASCDTDADAGTLARWRENVARTPSHPNSIDLELYERHRKNGPDIDEVTLWVLDQGHWRRNVDDNYTTHHVWDCGESGTTRWRRGDGALNLVNDRSAEPLGATMSNLDSEPLDSIGSMLSMALHACHGAQIDSVRPVNDGWEATLSQPSGVSWRLRGHWSPDGSELVDEAIENRPPRFGAGGRWALRAHRKEPALGRWVAGLADVHRMPGQVVRYELVSVDQMERSEAARMTTPPSPDDPDNDPIRGRLATSQIGDWRDGKNGVTLVAPDGKQTKVSIDVGPHRPRISVGQMGGFGIVAAGLGVVIIMRIRTRAV